MSPRLAPGCPPARACGFAPASVTPPAQRQRDEHPHRSRWPARPPPGSYPVPGPGHGSSLTRSDGHLPDGDPGGRRRRRRPRPSTRRSRRPSARTVGQLLRLRRRRCCSAAPAWDPSPTSPTPSPTPARTAPRAPSTPTSRTTASRSRRTDGTDFAPGKTVRIDATVWAWTTPSSDRLDLYYAANANSPTWTFIATLTPTAAGAQTLSATYTLPSGALQAVRAQFRYQGSASACASGAYNDRDDLVFAVSSPTATVVFDDNFETDQGWDAQPERHRHRDHSGCGSAATPRPRPPAAPSSSARPSAASTTWSPAAWPAPRRAPTTSTAASPRIQSPADHPARRPAR